jgi:hypothetical protein
VRTSNVVGDASDHQHIAFFPGGGLTIRPRVGGRLVFPFTISGAGTATFGAIMLNAVLSRGKR